jgi:hypothetical protein
VREVKEDLLTSANVLVIAVASDLSAVQRCGCDEAREADDFAVFFFFFFLYPLKTNVHSLTVLWVAITHFMVGFLKRRDTRPLSELKELVVI